MDESNFWWANIGGAFERVSRGAVIGVFGVYYEGIFDFGWDAEFVSLIVFFLVIFDN